MTDWNVPDWRDASLYPRRHEDLSPSQWRWEALRRRRDYRKDWLHWKSQPFGVVQLTGDLAIPDGLVPMPGCRRKYGFAFLHDPTQLEPPRFSGYPRAVYAATKGVSLSNLPGIAARTKTLEALEDQGIVVLAFDPSAKLGEQIERAQQHLKQLADDNSRRSRLENWPRHLRLIDAVDDIGKRWAEIGAKLGLAPEERATVTRRRYRSAKKWQTSITTSA